MNDHMCLLALYLQKLWMLKRTHCLWLVQFLSTAQFVQFNCNGIRSSRRELVTMLHSLGVAVCAVQETKLTAASSPPPTPGYTLVRRDRPGGGGGGAWLFLSDRTSSSLTNQFFPGDPTTEHQGILANLGGHQIACLNIYIPPCKCCPAGFQPDLAPLLNADYGADVLFMGDFNAHHPAWFSVSRDDRALKFFTFAINNLNNSE